MNRLVGAEEISEVFLDVRAVIRHEAVDAVVREVEQDLVAVDGEEPAD